MIPLLLRSASRARVPLVGVALLLCGFQLVIIGQAVSIQRSNAFGSLANLMPEFLQRGLGSRAMLLATFKGTVAFGYFHPVVCILIAVLAMYITTEVAHEVEAGLVDIELARSVPRHRLLTRSMLLAHAGAAAVIAMMALGTWLGVRVFDAAAFEMPSTAARVRLLGNLFALASLFSAFGLLVASGATRWVSAFTAAGLFAVVAYIADFLALGWKGMERFAWLSPFHYFPALSVLAGDAPMARNLSVLYTAAVIMSLAAYWRFHRRDL
jgi:ABC-type transport system involved in multi-copper enzyme maturation permease subunit